MSHSSLSDTNTAFDLPGGSSKAPLPAAGGFQDEAAALGECITCWCPSFDTDPNENNAPPNVFGSVGFSDAVLGKQESKWRMAVATQAQLDDSEDSSLSPNLEAEARSPRCLRLKSNLPLPKSKTPP